MEKIVVFSNMYPSIGHPTYGIFVENQVKLLQNSKVNVDVIAIDDPGKGKVAKIKKYGSWFIRSFIYMVKNRKSLSLTHAHYAFPTGILSLFGKRFMKIPYIVTVHGGDIDQMAKKSERIAKWTRNILNEAATVIVVGEQLKADVVGRFGVPEDRVQVISMGVNTAVFKQAPKEIAKKKLGLPEDEQLILFVGNVIKAKGVFELIEAFQIVKEENNACSLYLIGSQRDHLFMEELLLLIENKNLKDVHFNMPLSQEDLAHWMTAADVLALPSHHEGFGLVALEAMATGANVVGTDVGGLSYLLANKAGILVEPENPQSLAQGLNHALDVDNELIDKSVVESRVSAHSFDTILHRLLEIYQSVGYLQDKK